MGCGGESFIFKCTQSLRKGGRYENFFLPFLVVVGFRFAMDRSIWTQAGWPSSGFVERKTLFWHKTEKGLNCLLWAVCTSRRIQNCVATIFIPSLSPSPFSHFHRAVWDMICSQSNLGCGSRWGNPQYCFFAPAYKRKREHILYWFNHSQWSVEYTQHATLPKWGSG